MKFSLFGKKIFEFTNSRGDMIFNQALDKKRESAYLIDFIRDTGHRGSFGNSSSDPWGVSSYVVAEISPGSYAGVPKAKLDKNGKPVKAPKSAKKAEEPKELTPKDVYNLKTLDHKDFVIKTDPAYIEEQIASFKTKLEMVKTQEADWNYGTTEIGSMLTRLENRKSYPKFKDFFDQFAYTTNTKIDEMVKKHAHLKVGEVSQFMADLPKDAVNVMDDYTKECKKLCGKKPVFYIIANKKDFEKTQSRRDPILLAQSPFGHFWQILGAWDEEMLLLEEL